MQEINSDDLALISGGGNYADNVRDRAAQKRAEQKAQQQGNNTGGFYGKYGNEDCINGIFGGMVRGPLGLAAGAIGGGCFKDSSNGGGNIGMGSGGNKSNTGSCNGGRGTSNAGASCSW